MKSAFRSPQIHKWWFHNDRSSWIHQWIVIGDDFMMKVEVLFTGEFTNEFIVCTVAFAIWFSYYLIRTYNDFWWSAIYESPMIHRSRHLWFTKWISASTFAGKLHSHRRAGELRRVNARVNRRGSNGRGRHEPPARVRKRRHINLCNW